MKLVKIKIIKYKSIINPIEINLENGNCRVFIGKNGCGKTNLLRAIKLALSKNIRYGQSQKEDMQAEYYFRLTPEERKSYFPDFDLTEENGLIKVIYNGNRPDVKMIEAPSVKIAVKEFRKEAEDILFNFQKASKRYISNLREIESDNMAELAYININVVDDKGWISPLIKSNLDSVEKNIQAQKSEIEKLLQLFSGDTFDLEEFNPSSFRIGYLGPVQLYRIHEQNLKISPLVAKSLNLNKNKLETANQKLNATIRQINQELGEDYQNVQTQIDRFEKLKETIIGVFGKKDDERYLQEELRKNRRKKFLRDLQEASFANCYYIDNEDTLLFYPRQSNEYERQQKQIENLNSRNPLEEAFHLFLLGKGIYQEGETFLEFSKIDSSRREKFLKIINKEFLLKNVPQFDRSEIAGYVLQEENNRPVLYVREKDGTKINVNETSLGRRWYLTYSLIKSILKEGDYLLIDEPAAFLHPQAQVEIKKDLELLSSRNISVFYATHSPYMIPSDWSNIISLYSGEGGTQAKQLGSGDELCKEIEKELGDLRGGDVLFHLAKTLLLVEGIADKVCIEKFAELLKYDLSKYHIHVCDGDSIVQVSYLCIKNNIKFIAIADNDNKYKNEGYYRFHPNFQTCLKCMLQFSNKCFFIGEGKEGCLENLFSSEGEGLSYYDKRRNKWKIDKEKIKEIKSVEELKSKTIENFELLFKEIGLLPLDKNR